MKTPPMAGVSMKYCSMNTDSTVRMSPELVWVARSGRPRLRNVSSSGSQRALFRTSWGRARRSPRTSSGRNARRNAAPMPIRSGWAEPDRAGRPAAGVEAALVLRVVGGHRVVEEPLLGWVAPAGFGAGGPLGAGHGLSWGSCGSGGRVRGHRSRQCGVSAICFYRLAPPPACPRREVTHGSRPARGDHRARHRPRRHVCGVACRYAAGLSPPLSPGRFRRSWSRRCRPAAPARRMSSSRSPTRARGRST